jgi:hypothetical protein
MFSDNAPSEDEITTGLMVPMLLELDTPVKAVMAKPS